MHRRRFGASVRNQVCRCRVTFDFNMAAVGGLVGSLCRPDGNIRQGRRGNVNAASRLLFEPSRNCLFLLLSGLATGASWVCYFRALKIGDAAKVAPIDKLSVVLVALFGVIFLGERLTVPNWLGVALIAVGAILIAYR